jgi:hypothetical protein
VKRFLKWTALGTTAVLVGLLAPLGYVETACRPELQPDDYKAILPDDKHRDEGRTLMTYPEWHIVHAYEEYAEVIRKGDPHDFSYLSSIAGFWGSLCSLSHASGAHGGFSGDIQTTIYTIGVSFTAEMLAKATYEETIGRVATLIRGPDHSKLDALSADQAFAYGEFLQQVPWYEWDFAADAQDLKDQATDSFRDRERRLALGLEYKVKGAYAGVIQNAVAQMEPDALRLNMVVSGMDQTALGKLTNVDVIGPLSEGIEIETPRYRELTHLLEDMAGRGADFMEIAGNDDILLTVLSEEDAMPGAIHSVERQGFGDTRHLVLVKVAKLGDLLRGLKDRDLVLEHIHDY